MDAPAELTGAQSTKQGQDIHNSLIQRRKHYPPKSR